MSGKLKSSHCPFGESLHAAPYTIEVEDGWCVYCPTCGFCSPASRDKGKTIRDWKRIRVTPDESKVPKP